MPAKCSDHILCEVCLTKDERQKWVLRVSVLWKAVLYCSVYFFGVIVIHDPCLCHALNNRGFRVWKSLELNLEKPSADQWKSEFFPKESGNLSALIEMKNILQLFESPVMF